MAAASELIGTQLKWIQPVALKREFELLSDDQVMVRLVFRGSFDSLAMAEGLEGCWTFQRTWAWITRVHVRVCNTEDDIAVFRPHLLRGGGVIYLNQGRELLVRSNFQETEYKVETPQRELLIRLKTTGAIQPSAQFEVLPLATQYAELPWLIPFSWYLWLLSSMEIVTPRWLRWLER
jgi:hypothetical protein